MGRPIGCPSRRKPFCAESDGFACRLELPFRRLLLLRHVTEELRELTSGRDRASSLRLPRPCKPLEFPRPVRPARMYAIEL